MAFVVMRGEMMEKTGRGICCPVNVVLILEVISMESFSRRRL